MEPPEGKLLKKNFGPRWGLCPDPPTRAPPPRQAGYHGRTMPTARKPKSRRPLILAAAAFVLLAIVAYVATRGEDTAEAGETQPVSVEGQRLAGFDPEGDDPAVGDTAPTVSGLTFEGAEIEIAPGDEPKLVVFVAHWCPHCQREVPKIVSWLEDSGTPEGLAMMVVATATDQNRPNYPPSEWLEEEGLDLPTMADDSRGTAAEAYGLSGYPYFVLLDADNKVIARDTGELSTEELDGLVELATGS